MVDKTFLSQRFAGNAILRDCLNGRALLKSGSTGGAVRILQQSLIELNFVIPDGPTGNFLTQTKAAVMQYQSSHSLTPVDGIVGAKTITKLDADIAKLEKPNLKSLQFWINAFIPDNSISSDVLPAPGLSTGSFMAVMPITGRCFLGDSRGFSSDRTASARIHSFVEIIHLDTDTPRVNAPAIDIHCGESQEIDRITGAVIARAVAPTGRIHFSDLQLSTVAVGDPLEPMITLGYVAAAGNPLITPEILSPDIDMNGRMMIDRPQGTFTFTGAVDEFPAFEAYVSFNDGPIVSVLRMAPLSASGLIGGANRPFSTTILIAL